MNLRVCVCVCFVTQSCPALCDHMDCSPPGFSARGILQARILGGLPFPPPGDPPNAGIKLESPAPLPLAGRFLTTGPPGKPLDAARTPSVLALLPSPLTWTL